MQPPGLQLQLVRIPGPQPGALRAHLQPSHLVSPILHPVLARQPVAEPLGCVRVDGTVGRVYLPEDVQHLRVAVLFVAGIMCRTAVYGQTDTGSFSGVVLDETGAVGPRYTVMSVDESRGTRIEFETSETGEYMFGYIDPRGYVLSFES